MLSLIKQQFKILCLIFVAFLIGCKQDEYVTEISGRVTDIETNKPVNDVKIDFTISEGIDEKHEFVNPVNVSALTDIKGEYKVILPSNENQKFYTALPSKSGYIAVKQQSNIIAHTLKPNEKNLQNLSVAKGSFLKLSINKTSVNHPNKTLRVKLITSLNQENPPTTGTGYKTETLTFDAASSMESLIRGFYYKYTSTVKIDWEVTNNGSVESNSAVVTLKEYDIVDFEINY
jgi:hypothetical protein